MLECLPAAAVFVGLALSVQQHQTDLIYLYLL